MTDLHIPDVSKWQASVDFTKVGPAIILRAHSGRGTDKTLHSRQELARKHCRVIGYYGYVVADRDAAQQGREFAHSVGSLRPGEFAVCDIEEGNGDQSDRAEAWCTAADQLLGGRSWIYSGLSFRATHLSKVSGRRFWIAAYRSREPAGDHVLWQHADNHDRPGVGPCDCSIFRGDVDQLFALVTGQPTPQPTPAPAPTPAPTVPLTLQETAMCIAYVQGGATVLILTTGKVHVFANNAEVNAYKKLKVPVTRVTQADLDVYTRISASL